MRLQAPCHSIIFPYGKFLFHKVWLCNLETHKRWQKYRSSPVRNRPSFLLLCLQRSTLPITYTKGQNKQTKKKNSTANNTAQYSHYRLRGNYSRQRQKTQCTVDKIRLFLKKERGGKKKDKKGKENKKKLNINQQ